jgi:uncharacterized protein YeaC (DUF1315 family)
MNYEQELEQVENEIKQIQEQYQKLKVLFPWGKLPQNLEILDENKQDAAIRLMAYQERLDELKVQQNFYQQAILTSNVQHVKKSDIFRKAYKREKAPKDER